MTWHLGTPLAAFDLETTGVQVESDRVVTACIAVIRPTPIPPWDVEVNTWLIDPGVEIPAGAIEVHGITNERARRDGRNPVGALDEIAATLASAQAEGIPIVGANLAYDNTLLDRGLRRHNLRTVEDRLGRPLGPCIDVQVLDKHVDPYRRKAEGNRKLETLADLYGCRLDGAHDSTFDAMAAARIAYRLGRMSQMGLDDLTVVYAKRGRRRPESIAKAIRALAGLSLAELHDAQIGWRRAQQDGLRAHFDRAKTVHDGVPGDWPLIRAGVTR